MFMYDFKNLFKPEEVLVYLRKSRSDDPTLSVEEVLEKHETILDEWSENKSIFIEKIMNIDFSWKSSAKQYLEMYAPLF